MLFSETAFDIKKKVFNVSIDDMDGNTYHLEIPSIEEEEILRGDDGIRFCMVSYFADHDWIEYSIHTYGGDHDTAIDGDHDPIDVQIMDGWLNFEHDCESFYDFIVQEILLEECA